MQSSFIQNKNNQNLRRESDTTKRSRKPKFQTSFIESKNNINNIKDRNSNPMMNSYKSEILGKSESKILMKEGIGRFSRLDRFRMRGKSGMVSKRGTTGNRNSQINLANSVFESVIKPRKNSIYLG